MASSKHDWDVLQESGRYFLTKEECEIIKENQKIVNRLKKSIDGKHGIWFNNGCNCLLKEIYSGTQQNKSNGMNA